MLYCRALLSDFRYLPKFIYWVPLIIWIFEILSRRNEIPRVIRLSVYHTLLVIPWIQKSIQAIFIDLSGPHFVENSFQFAAPLCLIFDWYFIPSCPEICVGSSNKAASNQENEYNGLDNLVHRLLSQSTAQDRGLILKTDMKNERNQSSTRQIDTLKTRRRLGRVNFRKYFWGCY